MKALILDVDGVMTTGQFLYNADGKAYKIFGPDDSDGLKLIDKLIIVHIRLWYLEDATNAETDPEKIAQLKRKADITFKEKRPMLVKSLDKIITNMCNGKFNPTIENPKLYKDYQKEN